MESKKKTVLPLSPVPLYTQIKEILRTRILDGTYKAHEQMPSESDLIRSFDVSRITVRQALGHLQKEGLIFKIHGKGTYVSQPKAFQNLGKLQGFGEAMASMGYETFSQVVSFKIVPADKIVAKKLHLAENDMVSEIRRVRYLNRAPISLDVSYLPRTIGERLIKEDLAHRDIFLILENDYGYSLGQAELQIEAMLADESLGRLIQLEEGAPVLRIERLTFTTDNQPLDFEYLYYRGDAFQYRLRVERGRI
ncbi:GntR family transcriptional regulator [Sulfuriferula sp. AH1]|uniref:GntR family transcriptional regulator n=1 Tax=Sulfuriferula sp. AH1 TaxID=1985873 RepID=UPI000B3B70CF|nr:GntR family transcriptional regulator [Sulfuriferula sp. AH1]ARU30491.1 GntR family transcriptional regulator [Sulfuriferula sp. AH1]